MILEDKLMKYVLFQKRTIQEVKNKCNQLGYEDDYIEEIIAYLVENSYLDDDLYTMKYILNTIKLKKKSSKEIKFDLFRRGINEGIIEKYINSQEFFDYELKCAIYLARKKYKECNDILKVKKFLMNKGYPTQFVNKAIDTLKKIGDNEIEMYNNF